MTLRIVHISTADIKGGAALAAYRLHRGLRQRGQDSLMVVRRRYSADPHVLAVLSQPPADVETNDLAWGLALDQYLRMQQIDNNGLVFTAGMLGLDLSQVPAIVSADLIHLHWVATFQSPSTIRKLLDMGKPVVWTLHDQRPFTGGCHCVWGCRRFETDCRDCPQLQNDTLPIPKAVNLDQRRFYGGQRLHLVTPSQWMAQRVQKSALFRLARCHVIPNAVDTLKFHPGDRRAIRKRLGFDEQALILIHGSENLENSIKGCHLLPDIFKTCLQDRAFARRVREGRMVLILFGRYSPGIKNIPVPVRYMGEIARTDDMQALYAASDYLILPSLQDNLPNTMIEAMACGTPVIAFDTGGINEFVIHGKTGFLAPAGDLSIVSRHIIKIAAAQTADRQMRAACRKSIMARAGLQSQTHAMLDLYQSITDVRPSERNATEKNPVPGPAAEWVCKTGPAVKALIRPKQKCGPRDDACLLLSQLADPQTSQMNLTEPASMRMAALFGGWIEMGIAFHQLGRGDWAAKYCQSAGYLFQRDHCRQHLSTDALVQYAVLARELGEGHLALDALGEALLREPTSVPARYQQAVTLRNLGNWPRALEVFEGLAITEPESGDLWYQRAVTLRGLQAGQRALGAIGNALEFNPGFWPWLLEKAFILRDLRRYEEAVQLFDRVLAAQPDHFDAHHAKGAALALSGRCDAAVTQFKGMLDLFPGHSQLHLNISDAYRYAGRFEAALAALQPLGRVDAGYKGVNRKIAQVHEARGDAIMALKHYRAEHRLYPDDELASKIASLSNSRPASAS